MAVIACATGPVLLFARWRFRDGLVGKMMEGPSTVEEVGRRYDLGPLLGTGAFGEVFRATSRQGGGECALKIVGERGSGDGEAVVQRGLAHPHIAAMLDSFWAAGRLCIVTELCEGGTLFDALEHHGRYPEAEARPCFAQAMSAVAHLHANGVAHRDLKLESFLLERRGAPLGESGLKLIDFGFARRFRPGERKLRTRCGTRGYFAPEILRTNAYDERCDVYSCGVVLHCLLCDELPYPPQSLRSTSGGAVGPISFGDEEVKRSLTVAARRLIAWTLERAPEHRPYAAQVLDASWLQPRRVAC